MDLEDAEQAYNYLADKRKIKEEDILINAMLNGFIHMKNFNESEFNTERTREYFSNRIVDVEKFTDDIQSLNIYIYESSKLKGKK